MLLRERLEYSLLCMKIGAVLESADNSVQIREMHIMVVLLREIMK